MKCLKYKKIHLFLVDKYVYQCGFIEHINRISKAYEQGIRSVCVLFLSFKSFFRFFLISNATNHSFTLGLRVKGDKRATLTSFLKQKGGEMHESIFFSDDDRKSV